MKERVFITGVTGYVGSAVASRLMEAGYEVHGLTRGAERAVALSAAGVHPVVGDLARTESYLHALKNCDVVIHTAFDPANPADLDRLALEAVRAGAMDGRVRRLIYTSGVWVHGDTGEATLDETAPLHPVDLVRWRAAHEDVAIDLAENDMTVVVLRPGMVYGEGRGEFGRWFAAAHEKKLVRYPGSGAQHWATVHRSDLASAYLAAVERAQSAERFIITDGSSFTAWELAVAVAGTVGAATQSWETADLLRRLGLYGRALLTSQKLSSAHAERDLGWTPRHRSVVSEAKLLDLEWQESRRTPVR